MIRRRVASFVLVCSLFGELACSNVSQNGNLMRANARYREADYSGAIEVVDFVLGSGPVNTEVGAQAGLLKGRSLERLNRIPEAISVYEFVLDNYADSLSGRQAQARLTILRKK